MSRKSALIGLLVALLVLAGCPQDTSAKPRLTAVTPSVIAVGSPDTQLHLTGTGFSPPAIVTWNSTQLLSQFMDNKDIEATVPAELLTVAGVAKVFAQVGSNQTATQSLSITIGNVAPTLSSVAPAHAIVGAAPLTVTLTGTNFNSSSVANWNGTALPTTLVSATSLTAVVPTTDFATAGSASVTVSNAGTGGGTTTAQTFTIVAKLLVVTASLPGGSIGVPYSTTLVASGGVTPYSWSLASGTLPAGLTLNSSSGVISGTPTAAGSSTFTVQVLDSTGALARRRF